MQGNSEQRGTQNRERKGKNSEQERKMETQKKGGKWNSERGRKMGMRQKINFKCVSKRGV